MTPRELSKSRDRVALAIIDNAGADGRKAEFMDPVEKKTVQRLEKAGLVTIQKTKNKLAGLTIWLVGRTKKGRK